MSTISKIDLPSIQAHLRRNRRRDSYGSLCIGPKNLLTEVTIHPKERGESKIVQGH